MYEGGYSHAGTSTAGCKHRKTGAVTWHLACDTHVIATTAGESEASARLFAAAYNAFDSAAKKLGVNAVELAEAMRDGGAGGTSQCDAHVPRGSADALSADAR